MGQETLCPCPDPGREWVWSALDPGTCSPHTTAFLAGMGPCETQPDPPPQGCSWWGSSQKAPGFLLTWQKITKKGASGSGDEMLRHQCHPHPAHPLLQSLGGELVSAPRLHSPSLAVSPGIPMEAARCQLRNLLTLPRLPKWTMSLLIRYPPRGQMSAPLMAFLSSSLPRLVMTSERSGPITSRRLLPAGLPTLPAWRLCRPGGSSPTAPPPWAHHLHISRSGVLKDVC